MKSISLLWLALLVASAPVQAQYNSPARGNGYNAVTDALEHQALLKLDQALDVLLAEIRANSNFDFGRGSRGAAGADLQSIALSIKSSTRRLSDLTRGTRTRQGQTAITHELRSMNISAFNLINAIPGLTRRSANLIDQIFNVVKAVGAVELAVQAPSTGGRPPVGNYPAPRAYGKGAFCGLEFYSPNGTFFIMAGEGLTVSDALSNLHSNCATIGGATPQWSNAGVCQSKVGEAKCVDSYEMSTTRDSNYNRFASCSLNFKSPNGTAFVTSGAGSNLVAAVANLYDSCGKIGGATLQWSNANACRNAVAKAEFNCIVR